VFPALTGKLARRSTLAVGILALAAPAVSAASAPELAAAMQNLRDQRSYSWEIINGDPGPVSQSVETARGTIKTVQQNTAPHVRGRLSANGEMLLEFDWPDGLAMQTFVRADGTRVTNTPEGWLSRAEILEAIAAERMRPGGPSSRMQWLQLADAMDTRRPDQELTPLFDNRREFETTGDLFVCHLRIQTGNPAAGEEQAQTVGEAVVSIHVSDGVLRDYEIKSEVARYVSRARIPIMINGDRIVILTYLSVGRLNVPEEARAKLKAARPRSGGLGIPVR
jgi:hypothetical protein